MLTFNFPNTVERSCISEVKKIVTKILYNDAVNNVTMESRQLVDEVCNNIEILTGKMLRKLVESLRTTNSLNKS